MTTTHVGTVHLHDDGRHGYVRVETCPINVDLLALKLPPQRCLMHVGQTPEDSPEMKTCRFLDMDALGQREGDTIEIRCLWPDGMMRFVNISPAPLPHDQAAWEDVTVISGGIHDPTPEALRVSWLEQGVAPEDVDILKRHAAANVILTVRRLFHPDNQTARRYCLTERAVQDVQRAHERLEE